MLRLLLFLLLCGVAFRPVSAQIKMGQATLDSLLTELPRTKPDTNRVNLLYRISFTYIRINPNTGITYANQCLLLARQLKWKKGIVNAYNALGTNYDYLSDLPNALTSLLAGLKVAEEIKNKDRIATLTINIGNLYSRVGNNALSLLNYEKALKAYGDLGNKIKVALLLANIGSTYDDQGEHSKALGYFQKSLSLNEAVNFQALPAESIFKSIGITYLSLGDYPKALDYLQRGLVLSKVSGNRSIGIAIYNALSVVYLKIATDSTFTSLATLTGESRTSALQKARRYCDSTLVLVNDMGTSKSDYGVYQIQSEILDALGEPTEALASFKQYIATKDLIFNQDNADKIVSAALQYDFDKKETALQYEQQLTVAQLQKQTLLTKQQTQALILKEQAAQLANKERDVQRLQYLQERAQKQDKEKQLVIAQKEQSLKSTALELSQAEVESKTQQRTYLLAGFGLLMALLGFIVYGYSQQQKANKLLQTQRDQLEQALSELHTTQTQLVQKEKMASLGELTAGIAHEIQNPLNFVTNFSEVSTELVTELADEQQKPVRDSALEVELLGDLKQNLQKITHHGGRASAIVRGMLDHSRTSTGEKRPTDLNALADEYLKIAYHGLRAKDKDFNAELTTDFQADIAPVNVVPQELGRVLLNLYNNAFYAVAQQQKTAPIGYQPTVTVSTRQLNGHTQIRVSDNGTGIPALVQAKIFQPFFTTKPTGEGTGLGLSLSYDIVTKGHQGSLQVNSQEGQGTEFMIQLPNTAVTVLS